VRVFPTEHTELSGENNKLTGERLKILKVLRGCGQAASAPSEAPDCPAIKMKENGNDVKGSHASI